MPGFTSDKRLYLNEDKSKVVQDGDPDARFLLVGEGGQVSAEDAERYGLHSSGGQKQPSESEQREAALRSAEERSADTEAEVHRVAMEREEAARAANQRTTKARQAPPENKSGA